MSAHSTSIEAQTQQRPAPAAPVDGRSFAAAQAFLFGAKTAWTTRLYPLLREDYRRRVQAAQAQGGATPASPEDVAALLQGSTTYQTYAWLERHLQRFKYAGRYGLQPYHAQQRGALEAALEGAARSGAPLEVDPDLPMPRYYTSMDIHQHPGGVWSDPVAGYVYERGARSTTPLAGGRHADLHQRLTDAALARCPAPRRVLDMACGFGKSTRAFCQALPEAQIEAVDLAAPCVKLGAKEAADAGARNVRYRQMNACETDYPGGSFDLVTSTMFLHEMPPPMIEAMLAEAKRVLKPGARMVHLDFLPQVQPQAAAVGDPFLRFIHYGHGRRNNEPYMEPLARMDLEAALRRHGFDDIEIRPFEEAEGTLAPDYPKWRFPWTLIAARRAAD
ncbi:MAG: class I SAM-dependent methyltransferase [Betaproteobacteria bacterium]|nr:class I SAM-dependent methyltransferase [Betaproteobacteria bacterium]